MQPLDSHLLKAFNELAGSAEGVSLDPATASALLRIFDAQIASRHLDFQAHELKARGQGYYTIGSSGHESNAFLADALRPSDPAFLHYRSGAFYQRRSQQVPGIDGMEDVLLSLVATADDRISGGRHKVFGRQELAIIPTTSTIASHLPRALGTAFAIERAKKLGVATPWPSDAVVVCSFGDASFNHSTAQGALNATAHTSSQGLNVPVLFVCEDNGMGISVRTPADWVERANVGRPSVKYFTASGDDPERLQAIAREAANYVRGSRQPAFFHLRCVRYMGHAGSDVELSYRTIREIESDYARDPIVATARALVRSGTVSAQDLRVRYEAFRTRVQALADAAIQRPKLETSQEVMSTISPRRPDAVEALAATPAIAELRDVAFEGKLPDTEDRLTLAVAINRTLREGLAKYPGMLIFGEDVGRKGGVYGVTARLQKVFGPGRVFDTLLDEQSILGLALGTAVSGLLPVPEIQYLAYLHNAIDQLRGEAATQQFFSEGRYKNGMVIRIAGLAYQKGFGGHFHNDNSLAALRDVPGVDVAVPSRGDDAAAMLRTALAAAHTDGTITAFVEPIALYHERDLIREGDGGMLSPYLSESQWLSGHAAIGSAREYARAEGLADNLTIVTFGNGVRMSLRVAEKLRREGIGVNVLDLRWLNPLPIEDMLRAASSTGRVLVVDETRRSGGVSESVIAALVDCGFTGQVSRVTSLDSFVPLADAAELVLLNQGHVEKEARRMIAL